MEERILMAAAMEFNERGVKCTVDAVAARLGISKKTLYRYINSKEELIHHVVSAALHDVEQQEERILSSDRSCLDRLQSLLTVEPVLFGPIHDWIYDDLRRCCPEEWMAIEAYRENKMRKVVSLLEEGIAAGQLRPLNSQVAAQALRGAVSELINYQFLTANQLSLHDALQAVSQIFLYGVIKGGESGSCVDSE